jgi:hypothetical protein
VNLLSSTAINSHVFITKKSWFGFMASLCLFTISWAQPAIDLSRFKGMEAKEDSTLSKKDSLQQLKKKKKPSIYPLQSNYSILKTKANDFYLTDTNNYNDVIFYSANPLNPRAAWINLGEPGSPGVLLQIPNASKQMDIGLNPIATTLKKAENMKFYKANAPLSLLKYTQGNGRTFVFDAIHTQNFSPTWNVTLDYKSQLNEDLILGAGQNNTQRNTQIGSNFHSKNQKFTQFAIVTWNRLRRNEYGGINPSALNQYWQPIDTSQLGFRTFGPFESRLATPAKSFFGYNSHLLAHQYSLSKTLKIVQESTWEKTRFQYADTKRDTGFYGSNYFQYEKKINDSSAWNLSTHQLGIQLNSSKQPENYWLFHWMHQSAKTSSLQPNFSQFGQKNYATSAIKTEANYRFSAYSNFKLKASYFYSGYNQNGYHTEIDHLLTIKQIAQKVESKPQHLPDTTKTPRPNESYIIDGMRIPHYFMYHPLSISVNAFAQKQAPNLFDQQFYSNHFQYNNQFNQIDHNQVSFTLRYFSKSSVSHLFSSNPKQQTAPKNHTIAFIEFKLGSLSNPVFRLNSAQPIQILNTVNYHSINFRIEKKIKHFTINEVVSYQIFKTDSLNGLSNFGIPKFTSFTDLYLEYFLFKKTMRTRIGLNAWYMGSFTPVEYRPDALSFYYNLQQTHKSGNYLQLDAYLTAQIQSAIIYFKLEHFNETIFIPGLNPRYDFVSYYPIQPYRFRVGVQWKFYN